MALEKRDVMAVLQSYIRSRGVIRNQIESFDFFCTVQLPCIIRETPTVEKVDSNGVTHCIEFIDVHITRPRTREADGFVRPSASPHETALRGNSYLSDILVDLRYTRTEGSDVVTRLYTGLEVCKIPMMVGSRYCATTAEYDPRTRCSIDSGGYFVINSSEKSIICQKKLAINRCFIWPGKSQAKDKYVCEIRSCNETKLRSTSTLTMALRETAGSQVPTIAVRLPFVDPTATLREIYTLLGCDSLDDIMSYICDKNDSDIGDFAENILRAEPALLPRPELILSVGARAGHPEHAKAISYMHHIVACEFLPHVGLTETEPDLLRKRVFFGHMIRKLLLVYRGKFTTDDRDDYLNKRVDGPGMLMSLLFRQLWRQFLKSTTANFAKVLDGNKPLNVPDLTKATKVSSGILYAFSTGSWGVSKSAGDRAGVVQMMNRASFFAVLASLRRINTPVNKDSKSPPVRQLHASSWGIVCSTETPEGASCGLIKNLALLAHVRIGCATPLVMGFISGLTGFEALTEHTLHLQNGVCRLVVNGKFVGTVPDNTAALSELRAARSNGCLPFDTTVAQMTYSNCVEVDTDPGALCRPVFCSAAAALISSICAEHRADHRQKHLFGSLMAHRCIVYLEKKEEASVVVAADGAAAALDGAPYFEIHPLCILGLCANMIPFPEYNQAPRNMYQAVMGKQALGLPACNTLNRFDTVAHVLHNPHIPIVDTKVSEYIGSPVLPAGQMLVVGIMSYGGYNQEDSLIISAGAVERGMGRCDVYRTYKYDIPMTGQDTFKIIQPPTTCTGRKYENYDKLDTCGWPAVGTDIVDGDVLIGVVMYSKQDARDCSILYKHGPSVIDAVWTCDNKDGKQRVCVRTREHRMPRPGDKFSSRHGQKGVIGRILPHADMPYRQDGLVVDILINPHAIPSRMTIGHLLETEVGTTACMLGMHADGTAFQKVSVDDIADLCQSVLDETGEHSVMDKHCNSRMFCGISGEMLATPCFVGLTWYQKLKHMVRDKQHTRTTGPVAIMTRQLLEGRSRGGGLRFGEMEVQCLLAYGAAKNAREFLYNKSDPFKAFYCRVCGRLAEPPCSDKKRRIVRSKHAFCRFCDSFANISRIEIR